LVGEFLPGEIVVADDGVGQPAHFEIGAAAAIVGGVVGQVGLRNHGFGGGDPRAGGGHVADGDDVAGGAAFEHEPAAPIAVVGNERAAGHDPIDDAGPAAVAGRRHVAAQGALAQRAAVEIGAAAVLRVVFCDGAIRHDGVAAVDAAGADGGFVADDPAIGEHAVGTHEGAAAGAVLVARIGVIEGGAVFEAESAQGRAVGQERAAHRTEAERALAADDRGGGAVDGAHDDGVGQADAIHQRQARRGGPADGIDAIGGDDHVAGRANVDCRLQRARGGRPIGERRAGRRTVGPRVARRLRHGEGGGEQSREKDKAKVRRHRRTPWKIMHAAQPTVSG